MYLGKYYIINIGFISKTLNFVKDEVGLVKMKSIENILQIAVCNFK